MQGMRRSVLIAAMKRTIATVAVVLAACATPSVSRGVLVASTVALAADWQTTRCFAQHGWVTPDGWLFEEGNPIMGAKPDTRRVDLYFAAAAAINVLAWFVTPRRWRVALPVAVFAVSVDRAAHNAMLEHGRDLCGL